MKTPFPFEPPWTVEFFKGEATGKGLLPEPMKSNAMVFTVHLANCEVSANPYTGVICRNGTPAVVSEPGPILWFRRMEFSMGTHDKNAEDKPTCLFYGLGFGDKLLMKVFADGNTEVIHAD